MTNIQELSSQLKLSYIRDNAETLIAEARHTQQDYEEFLLGMLLDEHTAALDPKTAAKVLQLTESLVRKNGLTTLMVTHNMQDAISYGDRLVMMAEGCVVYDVEGKKKDNLTAEELTRRFVRPLISVAG